MALATAEAFLFLGFEGPRAFGVEFGDVFAGPFPCFPLPSRAIVNDFLRKKFFLSICG